ncbi:MAG: T9SS type A sorting domain-containing protein [Candidatus Marinimicrobia bacterium]|nr:T9SS type A sorting domain-containing protein [Candidatus Neomarinimicrobiota bacterium]
MKKTNLVLVLLLFASGSFLFAQALGPQPTAYHTVGLHSNGMVYCWGCNDNGQLGDNSITQRLTPIQVLKGAYNGTTYLGDDSGNKITAVALGEFYSVALAADGMVYTWGYNNHGQLGDNSTTQRNTPVKVLKGAYTGSTYLGDDSDNKITAVAQGKYHSIALAEDGTVYTWGYNIVGQLGNNSTTQSNIPVKVLKGAYSEGATYLGDDSGNKIIAVALGEYYSLALAADGTVYSWGCNDDGQLGNNSTTQSNVPIKVLKGVYSEGTAYLGDNSSNKMTAIALGKSHSIALAADGTLYSWGRNDDGQLGDGTEDIDRLTPIKVLKGAYSEGTTYLGDNSGNKITAVALGQAHSIALATDGTVYAWGCNGNGRLGDNTQINRHTPIKVLKGAYSEGTTYLGDNSGNKITDVALGLQHSIALAADGTLYSWGQNTNGQLGNNTTTPCTTPIKVNGVGGTGDLALPVTLVSFAANSQNGNITLTWRTESETENLGYILERSSADNEWETIADYQNCKALQGHGSTTESYTYQYVDNTVQSGVTYAYRLGDVDYSSNIIWHKEIEITIEAEDLEILVEFGLQKAYPNPFNPEITLSYGLTEDAHTTLLIYDMRGQLVETLQDDNMSAGNHSIIWQPMNISTGMYIVRLQSGTNTSMQKTVYVK